MKYPASHVLISLVVAGAAAFSYGAGLFFGTERFLEDLMVAPKPVDSRIVVVGIDDESLSRLGQWPWPREYFAAAFLALERAKPLAVGFDVVLAERSRLGNGDDAALASALLETTYPLVFPVEGPLRFDDGQALAERLTEPLPQFFENARIAKGHVNLIMDKDGVVRRVPLSIGTPGGQRKAMAALLAEAGGAAPADTGIVSIVYAAPPGAIRQIPFYRLLEEDLSETLRGKIVLIGATSPDLHDEKPTPLSKGTEMAGVEIQANVANMLLMGYREEPLSPAGSYALLLFAALAPGILFSRMRGPLRALLASFALLLVLDFAALLLHEGGTTVNLFHLNAAALGSMALNFAFRFFVGEREQRALKGAFSKYVSPQVLDEILSNPSRVVLGGEEREITVLFSDIRGFTTLSERVSAHELVAILNRYFTLMTGEVQKHGGVLDKYIGDAVMAFWGAPLPDDRQAENALRAAFGMLERLKELNVLLKKEKGVEIDIGIGIYTGPAVVGNIGSDQRFDYTAMGDTVNVASRLEGLNKEHGTRLIVGEPTKEKIAADVRWKAIGDVRVKGRNEPVRIYTAETV
ncbi:MAG: adenylate/guanylate cyclase domain-containing protein [bacterium]|nr:adenylate/guanylate cyclase domain-containing protein [bacterium]